MHRSRLRTHQAVSTSGARVSRIAATAIGIALLSSAFAAVQAQECPPPGAVCPLGGTAMVVDFEPFAANTPVEGLGTVHPDLAIATAAGITTACTVGSAHVIEELDPSFPSYGTSVGSNGCLNGIRGFGDASGCVLDYEFTFSAGTTVSCFGLLMLDYGDLFPFGTAAHVVTMTAYAGTTVVDTDVLSMSGPVQLVTGDACDAQDGNPGRYRFRVVAPGITRVTLTFDDSPDPNVGFDDIQFCKDGSPVGVDGAAWGKVKTLYRVP